MNTSISLSKISELTNLPIQDVQSLSLADRNISMLQDMSPLVKLSKLDLTRNQLTNDALEGITECPSLSVLNLSENQLETFARIDKLKDSLTVLNVSGNPMYHLSSHLLSLTKLKALIGKNMHLVKIENIGRCKELNTLILANNKITAISNLKSLSQLKKLSLTQNPIRTLPDLSHHTQLKELRLNACLLESLPESIRKLSVLEILDIGNNRIHELKSLEGIGYLTHLTQLNVKGNPFCTSESKYDKILQKWCPGLVILDGQRLSRRQAQQKRKVDATDTPQIASSTSHPLKQSYGKVSEKKDSSFRAKTTPKSSPQNHSASSEMIPPQSKKQKQDISLPSKLQNRTSNNASFVKKKRF